MTKQEILRCPQPAGAALVCPHAPTAPGAPVCRAGSHDQQWEYMHQVPGRLRLRTSALRRNPDRAGAIEKTVKAIEGVSAVAVNLLTGSLTVIYDPSCVTPEVILALLRSSGLSASPRRSNSADTAVRNAGRAVLYLVLDHIVERSVKAALAVLL